MADKYSISQPASAGFRRIDWVLVLIYLALVISGWFLIYSSEYTPEVGGGIHMGMSHGKQLINIGAGLFLATVIMMVDSRVFHTISYLFYLFAMVLLLVTLAIGTNVNGAKGWLKFGSFMLQTAEIAKVASAMALAKYLSDNDVDIRRIKDRMVAFGIIALPMLLVLIQNDTGSAIVFLCLSFMLYREGLSGWWLVVPAYLGILSLMVLIFGKLSVLIGVGVAVALAYVFYARWFAKITPFVLLFVGISTAIVFGVDYGMNNLLQEHQRDRIEVLIGQRVDPKGVGYNVHQSLIAIGSGGVTGKGYLSGTQTKFRFVPEQSTDFIFCTVGEEFGLLGSMFIVGLYLALISRLVIIAERQKFIFNRCYAYGILAIFFFHFAINVGMTIGVLPVIGIPLPFLSYGGSSMLSFTLMLFLMIKLDADNSAY